MVKHKEKVNKNETNKSYKIDQEKETKIETNRKKKQL